MNINQNAACHWIAAVNIQEKIPNADTSCGIKAHEEITKVEKAVNLQAMPWIGDFINTGISPASSNSFPCIGDSIVLCKATTADTVQDYTSASNAVVSAINAQNNLIKEAQTNGCILVNPENVNSNTVFAGTTSCTNKIKTDIITRFQSVLQQYQLTDADALDQYNLLKTRLELQGETSCDVNDIAGFGKSTQTTGELRLQEFILNLNIQNDKKLLASNILQFQSLVDTRATDRINFVIASKMGDIVDQNLAANKMLETLNSNIVVSNANKNTLTDFDSETSAATQTLASLKALKLQYDKIPTNFAGKKAAYDNLHPQIKALIKSIWY